MESPNSWWLQSSILDHNVYYSIVHISDSQLAQETARAVTRKIVHQYGLQLSSRRISQASL